MSTTLASLLAATPRVAAHRAGADRVVERRQVAADPVPQVGVAADVRARRQLGLELPAQRPGRGELAGHADCGDQRVEVGDVGQVRRVDERLVPGVGAAQPDLAAAADRDQRDQHRQRAAGRIGETAVDIGHRQHVPLDVGRGQRRVGAAEPARLGDVGRHRARCASAASGPGSRARPSPTGSGSSARSTSPARPGDRTDCCRRRRCRPSPRCRARAGDRPGRRRTASAAAGCRSRRRTGSPRPRPWPPPRRRAAGSARPVARPASMSTPVTRASVWIVRLGRPAAGCR